MTHELKKIIQAYELAREEGIKTVLTTVVALEGSSYRRPGVRMLILENGKMIGAVSGGCVEKEILQQANSVFNTGLPKMMTYDGRYRLGCEGILYILIEPFQPDNNFPASFWAAIKARDSFNILSCFIKKDSSDERFGSVFQFSKMSIPARDTFILKNDLEIFEQNLEPCSKLVIIGTEHDAVQLCSFAALTGWEVRVIATPSEEKNIRDFPGALEFHAIAPEELSTSTIDDQTVIVLMTHSYVKDLKYLLALKDTQPAYLGLLGPAARRERLLGEFLEHCPEVSDDFFDRIHGPAGINIGAETPQEISIAILSEIIAVLRKQEPMPLKNKKGTIHS